MRKLSVISLLVTSLVALPVAAHHGWSSYDNDKPLTLTGNVVEASYTYPHGTIKLDTGGKTWLAVLAPPSRMSARGLSSEDLKAGVQATVEGIRIETIPPKCGRNASPSGARPPSCADVPRLAAAQYAGTWRHRVRRCATPCGSTRR